MRIFCLLFLFFQTAYCQILVTPVFEDLNRAPEKLNSNKNILRTEASQNITLNLPFFDDFFTSNISQDTLLWMPFGANTSLSGINSHQSVFVNNSYPIFPRNKNVATFDGLDYNGKPYQTFVSAKGPADYLTSRPFNLQNRAITDTALYISFFWQCGGKGDFPEAEEGDSLILQFKSKSGKWRNVWQNTISNIIRTDTFYRDEVKISDSLKFDGFQFRFISLGNLSGNFDVWHIDYVYMAYSQSIDDRKFFLDRGFKSTPSPLIKNYTALTFDEFKNNTSKWLIDTVSVKLYNYNNTFSFFDTSINIYSPPSSNTNIFSQLSRRVESSFASDFPILKAALDSNLVKSLITKPTYLQAQYTIDAQDIITPINFRKNDTISFTTFINNFLAYDDGIPENVIGINQRLGRVAVKYNQTLPDTLTDIDIYFLQRTKSFENTNMQLYVWKALNNSFYADTLARRLLNVKYSSDRKTFTRYKVINSDFSNPVIVSGDFYIGYAQNQEGMVTLGYDLNNDNSDKLFFDLNGKWQAYNTQADFVKGTILIRPVFRSYTDVKKDVVLGLEFEEENDLIVYPNPAKEGIYFNKDIRKVSLFSIYGILLEQVNFIQKDTKWIFKQNILNGLYILDFEDDKGNKFRKKIQISF